MRLLVKPVIDTLPALGYAGGMGILGLLTGILSGVFMIIGLIPFLGWLNWFTTLPASILAIIFSVLGLAGNPKNRLALAGLIIGFAVAAIALFRLSLGFGII